MNLYTIALFSLILLAPVLFFVKIGFSNKGKVFILLLSFIFAMIGILTKSFFALWQTISILFLLIVLTTYLVRNKLDFIMLPTTNGQTNDDYAANETKHEILTKFDAANEMIVQEEVEVFTEQDIDQQPLSFMESQDEETLFEETLIEEERMEPKESFEEPITAMEEIQIDMVEEHDDEAIFDSTRVVSENDLLNTEESNSTEPLGNNYMAELEQFILEGDEFERENVPDAMTKETVVIDAEEILDLTNVEQVDSPTLDILDEEEIIHSNSILPIDEVAVHLDHEIDDFEDELDGKLESVLVDESEIETDEESFLPSLVEEESDLDLNEKPKNKDLQQQLFKNMVSQLQLMKKYVEATQYENMLKEYLQPNLPLNEYYTFASLLIQHYISLKQYDKLFPFLQEIEPKVTKYPYILQELQFLQAFYFKK